MTDDVTLLTDMVQKYVEANDDKSAYEYQIKKCTLLRELYGEDDIRVKRAELYQRELKIRISPIGERVAMCRTFWEDVKRDYGEMSFESRLIVQLYLVCCWNAQELEELRILCDEIVEIFKNSEDNDDKMFVDFCRKFVYINGEESGNDEMFEAVCREATDKFGINCEYTLHMWQTLGERYRKSGDKAKIKKALKIHQKYYAIAKNVLGLNSRITLLLGKGVILDLAMLDRLKEALKEADALRAVYGKVDSKVEKPDIDECYFLIYGRMGKYRRAEKYAHKSMMNKNREYGDGAFDSLDGRMKYAVSLAARGQYKKAADYMSDYMARREEYLYGIFLSDSEARREAYFAANENNTYGMYLFAMLDFNKRNVITQKELFAAWENICNYKNLLGDCEFLHGEIKRDIRYSGEIAGLSEQYAVSDAKQKSKIERRMLEIARNADFRSFVKGTDLMELSGILKPDEILIDYYMEKFSDLRAYVAVIATRNGIVLHELGDIDETDKNIDVLLNRIEESDNIAITTTVNKLSKSLGFDKIDLNRFKKIYICADGKLYRMPFDVFGSDTTFLYLTNVKDLIRSRKKASNAVRRTAAHRTDTVQGTDTVSVFASPDFDLNMELFEAHDTQERGAGFAPLPGTYVEAVIIENLFGNRAKLYLYGDANVSAFRETGGADVLHLGTHAGTENMGTLYFTGANNIKNGEILPGMYGRGCLTAAEIAGLNLSNTKLAVLSACQTAGSGYKDYLGIRGLHRAFQLAGVMCIIASLWEINDMATAIFMKKFYESYKKTSDAVESLVNAKKYMRHATVGMLMRDDMREIAGMLKESGNIDVYREFRDKISSYGEDEKIFSEPRYHAGFVIFV